jgi:hypothetical protein
MRQLLFVVLFLLLAAPTAAAKNDPQQKQRLPSGNSLNLESSRHIDAHGSLRIHSRELGGESWANGDNMANRGLLARTGVLLTGQMGIPGFTAAGFTIAYEEAFTRALATQLGGGIEVSQISVSIPDVHLLRRLRNLLESAFSTVPRENLVVSYQVSGMSDATAATAVDALAESNFASGFTSTFEEEMSASGLQVPQGFSEVTVETSSTKTTEPTTVNSASTTVDDATDTDSGGSEMDGSTTAAASDGAGEGTGSDSTAQAVSTVKDAAASDDADDAKHVRPDTITAADESDFFTIDDDAVLKLQKHINDAKQNGTHGSMVTSNGVLTGDDDSIQQLKETLGE